MSDVDQCARAICAVINETDLWGELPERHKGKYREAALSVLRTIVNPSRRTIEASGMMDREGQGLALSIFQDMVNHMIFDGE